MRRFKNSPSRAQ